MERVEREDVKKVCQFEACPPAMLPARKTDLSLLSKVAGACIIRARVGDPEDVIV